MKFSDPLFCRAEKSVVNQKIVEGGNFWIKAIPFMDGTMANR